MTDPAVSCVLSDTEDNVVEDEEEDIRLQESIRKDLFTEFGAATPMKLSRESVSHNREAMKVFLRVRPFTNGEIEEGESQECLNLENSTTLLMRAPSGSFAFKTSQRGLGHMNHKFTFSKIFDEHTSQKMFFDETMLGTVKDFIDGQNCLVFTYGVTNAGKTYTIQGIPQDGGILPRTLDVIFNSIENQQFSSLGLKPRYFCDVVKLSERQQKKEEDIKAAVLALGALPLSAGDQTTILEEESMTEDSLNTDTSRASCSTANDSHEVSKLSDSKMSNTKDLDVTGIGNQTLFEEINMRIPDDTTVNVDAQGPIKFSIWVSFAEIYNEYTYDLLEPLPKEKKVRRQALKLAEDKHGSIYIKGLKEIQVSNADEAYRILKIGQRNLSIAATKLNHCSSRSHCIFSIKILRVVDVNDPHVARISQLSFCDLAGSERYTRTQNTGDRLKEAGNINTSLLTLGKCIHTLRYNQNHPKSQPKIIPFRESKLTRLFQSFFLGKGKASMIVNVNQCASGFDETMHVLKFSAIAKQVTTVTSKLDNKWKEQPKKMGRSMRNLSLALNQALDDKVKGQRPSVPWATPGTIAQVMRETGHMQSIEETVFEEEEEAEETEEDVESDSVETPIPDTKESDSQIQQKLLAVIEVLKQKLVEERADKLNLETEIRKEVCQEMADQLVEIEQEYNDRIEEEKQRAEEVFEKRLEIYAQSVKKAGRKRARQDDEPLDTDHMTALLAAERNKVKDRDAMIEKLTSDLQSSECNLKEFEERMHTEKQLLEQEHRKVVAELTAKVAYKTEQMEETTSLRKMLDDAQTKLEDYDKEAEALRNKVNQYETQAEDTSRHSKLFQDMMRKLEEETKVRNEKEARITELEQELTKSQEVLKRMEDAHSKEIEDLNGMFTSQSERLAATQQTHTKQEEEHTVQISDLLKQVSELKSTLSKQTQEAMSNKQDFATKEEQLKVSNAELTKQIEDLTSELSTRDEKLESLQKAHLCQEDDLKVMNSGLIKETEKLKSQLTDQTSQLAAIEQSRKNEEETLRSTNVNLLKQLEEAQASQALMTQKQEESKSRMDKLMEELHHNRETQAKQTEEQKAEILCLRKELERQRNETRTEEKEYSEKKQELTNQMNKELKEHECLVRDLEERIEVLGDVQKQLDNAKEEVKEQDAQITSLHRKIEEERLKVKQTEERLAEQFCAEIKSHEETQQEMRATILENKLAETEAKQQLEKQETAIEEMKVMTEAQQKQIEKLEETLSERDRMLRDMARTRSSSSAMSSSGESYNDTIAKSASAQLPSTTSLASTVSTMSNIDDEDEVVVIEQEDQKGYKPGRLSRVEIDATPLQKKSQRKGRSTRATKLSTRSLKKRAGDENSDAVSSKKLRSEDNGAPCTRGQSRRATRASSKVSIHEDVENIPEESKSPSTTSSSGSSQRRGPLARINEYLQNSPIGKSAKRLVDTATGTSTTAPEPAVPSPPRPIEMTYMGAPPADAKRKKRKLYKTDISAPYECSPDHIINLGEAKPTESSGAVITRKLRSRSKKN
ncbi:uncharacterized protein [Diadema antillarum]|uniref:uncharacterized protein isoform X2 n=1 Tax=Diadema antillarum TaxID=105358 RepID=UPI003A854B4A